MAIMSLFSSSLLPTMAIWLLLWWMILQLSRHSIRKKTTTVFSLRTMLSLLLSWSIVKFSARLSALSVWICNLYLSGRFVQQTFHILFSVLDTACITAISRQLTSVFRSSDVSWRLIRFISLLSNSTILLSQIHPQILLCRLSRFFPDHRMFWIHQKRYAR